MAKKQRIDILLVEKGLIESRQKARALIMAGAVFVNGQPAQKPGQLVSLDAEIEIKETIPYVSRGGLKLEEALREFNVDVKDKVAMDIGASTGGFTDCLLQHGARRVYAVDVGYGQLHWNIRQDPRVVVLERTNIRYLPKEKIPEEMDLITIDVSFISLEKVLPKAKEFLKQGGEVLALVKPQFEVGPEDVDRGGVVKDEKKRQKAVERVIEFSKTLGFQPLGQMACSVHGQKKGNVEYFVYLKLSE
ncbi:MAG: TlyA family RNA methyltransferase [Nitrospirae bacterium]|nr:MAG: TlyA family RNA methyltransferase [Nitrospirota bacterium]